jgi:hypothetical protein
MAHFSMLQSVGHHSAHGEGGRSGRAPGLVAVSRFTVQLIVLRGIVFTAPGSTLADRQAE